MGYPDTAIVIISMLICTVVVFLLMWWLLDKLCRTMSVKVRRIRDQRIEPGFVRLRRYLHPWLFMVIRAGLIIILHPVALMFTVPIFRKIMIGPMPIVICSKGGFLLTHLLLTSSMDRARAVALLQRLEFGIIYRDIDPLPETLLGGNHYLPFLTYGGLRETRLDFSLYYSKFLELADPVLATAALALWWPAGLYGVLLIYFVLTIFNIWHERHARVRGILKHFREKTIRQSGPET